MAENNNFINVGGRLHSIATGNVLAGTDEIYDDGKGKKQSTINAETDAILAQHTSVIQGLNSQNYETYAATNQTIAVTDVLPATGSVNTVYRLGNWDGSQFDSSCYTEYSWDGTQYVPISTKTQIDEVFDISTYHASGDILATYADLSAALDSNNGGGVPQSLQRGGMSIKFVCSSDNKYVQYRLMSNTFSTIKSDWQGVDNEPTAGSDNLIKSGGVAEQISLLEQETTKAIDDIIIGEILQNGQLAVLKGDGIECATETRSGFIDKNGNLVENAGFQTAIVNVTNNKAYRIYAPIAGSESALNRLHLFAEENGNSPICGSYLTKYNSSFYAIFPPEVKSISVTSSTITTLSVLEYDIANSETFSFFNSKNEELGQKLTELEQYLYKRYNAQKIKDNSLQNCETGVIQKHLDYFIVEGIPVLGFENIKIARTVNTADNGIGIVFYNSNDEMLSGYSTKSEIDVVVPDSAVYANLTVNKNVYNSIKQLLFQPYSDFSSRDLDKKITEISHPEFDINNNPISGEYIKPNGEAISFASYNRTDYIELFKGTFLFKLNFGLNLAQSTSISFYDENKNFVFSITGPDSSQSYIEQEVNFSEHPNVRYFRATLYGNNLYAFCKKVDSVIIPTDTVITELEQTISDVKQTYGEVTDTTTKYESVEGVVFNGKIQVVSAYPDGFHSKPFWCKRGDIITITQRRNRYALSALYKTDESESYFETLIHGTASQSFVTKECYIQEDGWYGVSGRTNSFVFAKKSISDGYILKATSMDGIKKTIDLTITNGDVVIGDAPVCQFIGSRAYSIKGNGNKTISVSLSETPIGRCFSVGLRIPYATQDVAKVTINGLSYSMASPDERTASGKSYMMEGDHYHRYNFDTRYTEINSFDIVVESEADWEIMLSANCIVDDEMDCCPVMIGYDLTEQYNGYFDYNGESINVYELHKRLNIPYYIAISKGTVITIQEVQDAIDSGLAEVVFYSGGPAMTPLWNKTDGSFAEKLWQDKCAVGIDADMNVLSQSVIDRNIYRNLKNAGFKILRHLSQNAGKFSAIADKYGDNDMYISYGYGLGTSSVLPKQLRFPLIMYSHGIGTSIIPNDPYYPSHYVDFDGTRTINTFKYLKSQERIGEVKCLKPSDWFAYIKGSLPR